MTSNIRELEDCPVIIYNSGGNFLIKAVVVEYDPNEMLLEVSEELPGIRQGERLLLLIIHSGGASEFSATARKVYNGRREMSIFSERQREGRAALRHELNSPAVIQNVIVDNVRMALQQPLQVTVENLSSTGALLKSVMRYFAIGNTLEIEVNIGGQDAMLYGKVVREQLNRDNTVSYGCKFVFS